MHLQIPWARLFFIVDIIELTTGATIKGEESHQDAIWACRWPSQQRATYNNDVHEKTTEREALGHF